MPWITGPALRESRRRRRDSRGFNVHVDVRNLVARPVRRLF